MNEIITHPISYDVLDVPNIWKAGMEEQRVGYFWPEYINMEGHMDKDGNSYIEEAKEAMLKERAKWKYDRVSSNTVMTRKAERPMTIDEAVLKTGGSPFPVVDLKDRLIDLQTNKIYRGMESIGRLTLNGDASVTWKEDLANELTPIYGLDYDESNRRGATIIYDHPQRKDGEVYKDRYIAGIDPIDFNIDEVGNKYSLMSCYVMDTFTETIVAEYVGRADIAKDGYENIRRLLIYFHAKANYENQLKGIFGYFESRNSMYLLCDTPKILFQKLDMKLSHDRKKGTAASPKINSYARGLQADWLTRPVPGDLTNKEGDTITNLQRLKSRGLIEEYIKWHKDGNFDRISSMGMLMILLDEQESLMIKGDTNKDAFKYTKLYSKAFNIMRG